MYRGLLNVIACCCLLAGWGSYTAHNWWGTILYPLAGFYWLFLRRWDRRWAIARQFRQRPNKDEMIEYIFTDDGLCIHTSGSESKSVWDVIFKVARTKQGFLIFPSASIFYWLPFHAFAGPEQVEKLDQILKARVPRYSLTK